MADITWPTDGGRIFDPQAMDEAIEFNVELTTSRSGRVSTLSLPGARWMCTLRFRDEAVSKLLDRRQLEAFFAALRGGADRLLLWNLLTPEPLGTMRGTVTLAATVAAGASTATLTGGYAAPNLLKNSGFEIDSNADGVADQYSIYHDVLPANLSKGFIGGNDSPNAQRYTGDITAGHALGVLRTQSGIVAGQTYSFSVDCNSNSLGLTPVLYIGWYTAGSVFISAATHTGTPDTGWVREALTATAPPTAAIALLYAWHANTSGATIFGAAGYLDNMQFEASAVPTTYAGLPTLLRGDRIAFGGQRVMLTADATATDAGTATVSFQPLHRAGAASGAAVTLVRPTTRYVLAQPVVQMPAQGSMLPGFAVELVEE